MVDQQLPLVPLASVTVIVVPGLAMFVLSQRDVLLWLVLTMMTALFLPLLVSQEVLALLFVKDVTFPLLKVLLIVGLGLVPCVRSLDQLRELALYQLVPTPTLVVLDNRFVLMPVLPMQLVYPVNKMMTASATLRRHFVLQVLGPV